MDHTEVGNMTVFFYIVLLDSSSFQLDIGQIHLERENLN